MNKPTLTLDINLAVSHNPEIKHLLHISKLEEYHERIATYHAEITAEKKSRKIRFQELPYQSTTHIKEFKESLKGKFDTLVVLGIGGSALGNIALASALCHSYQQIQNPGGMRLFVTDNVDPDWFSDLFDVIDLNKTLFNVISKSGGTAETMSQFLYVWDLLVSKLGAKAKDHMVATTDANAGYLLDIANELQLKKFVVPDGVGGRFSVLSDVGLLSSALIGIDIDELLLGAADMEKRCSVPDVMKNPAYLNSLIHYLYDHHFNKSISVMMPYSSTLKYMADWYAQLWGESLGKRYLLNGHEAFVGQTPVKAVGPTDQHSQVQLYCEGPNDKVFTLVEVVNNKRDIKFKNPFKNNPGTDYLDKRSMNELIRAELHGTAVALADAERPVVKMIVPEVSAYTVGQMIMLYELQTAMSGKLYQINPYDQPGVEAGKKATFALMGRPGYESEKKRIETSYPTDPAYII